MAVKPPVDLGKRGRKLWRDVVEEFDLTPAELEILRECGRNLDHIDAIQADITSRGVMIPGSQGQDRLHPGLAQVTSLQGQIVRALGKLGVLSDDGDDSVSQSVQRFNAAQNAANARWSK